MSETEVDMRPAKGSRRGKATVQPMETVRVPTAATVTKTQFAALIGVSKGRVSQLVEQGLPVEGNGRIDPARGRVWYQDNVDGRGVRQVGLFDNGANAREERDFQDARMRRLKADQLAGSLVEKETVERYVFGRARADRDAWQNWPTTAAAEIAAEMRIDELRLLPVLQRAVRRHLDQLSEKPHDDPSE